MKDGGHSIQSCRDPAAGTFGYLASQGANQRLNRGPANVCSRWAGEDGIQRCLLRLVHGKGNRAFLVPQPLRNDSTFRYRESLKQPSEDRQDRKCCTLTTGRRTGRSLPEARETGSTGGGKSELRRAVCRITSGTRASRLVDGQCHRKETASATPLPHGRGPPWRRKTQVGPACRECLPLRQLQRRGKGEMVR